VKAVWAGDNAPLLATRVGRRERFDVKGKSDPINPRLADPQSIKETVKVGQCLEEKVLMW